MKRHGQANGPSWVKRVVMLMLLVVVGSFSFFAYSAMQSHPSAARTVSTGQAGETGTTGEMEGGASSSAAAASAMHEAPEQLRTRQDVSNSPKTAPNKPSSASAGAASAVAQGTNSGSGSGSGIVSGGGGDNENANFAHMQKSKYTYVTLISGIDDSFKYRGFLYNALIMRKALADAGSTADFVAMVGFTDEDRTPFEGDMQLLRDSGILLYVLPRWVRVICHLSHVTCHMSHVTCHMSHVTCVCVCVSLLIACAFSRPTNSSTHHLPLPHPSHTAGTRTA